MSNIERLIKILLDKQNELNHNMSLIDKKPLLEEINKTSPLSFLINLTQDQYNYIIELMGEELSVDDLKIVKYLSVFNDNILDISIFNDEQLKIINEIIIKIKNKYDALKIDYEEKDKIDILLDLLKSNNKVIASNDYLENIISDSFNIEEQIEIYKELNSRNIKMLSNRNTQVDDEVLSEDDLIISNNPEDKIDELFRKYNINWSIECSTVEETEKRNKKCHEFKLKLMKYGDLEKMDKILAYLREMDLSYIFSLPEVLTNTLLYSSKEKIQEFIDTVTNEFGMDYKQLIRDRKQNLYPTIREVRKTKRVNKNINVGNKEFVTGSLNTTLGALKWLRDNGFSVKDAYNESTTVLGIKASTMQKSYDRLKMYGISLKDEDGKNKKGIYVLDSLNVMDKLDVVIESSAYQYFQEHVYALREGENKLNIYAIKLALLKEKESDAFEPLFYSYNQDGKKKLGLRRSYLKKNFGLTKEETFKKYGAVLIKYQNNFEELLKNNELDKISDSILNDEIIYKLDRLYKQDELRYNFNGTIISRKKVLRIFSALKDNNMIFDLNDAIMFAITRNSMLNEEELGQVKVCVSYVLNGPVRRY